MISLVIPAYDMAGRGVEMLRELLASIQYQDFDDYEIIVSDDGGLANLLDRAPSACPEDVIPGVRYVHGKEGAAANLNNAIDHARGDIIKPMFQDDKFMEPDTLQDIANAFTGLEDCYADIGEWLACTSRNVGEGADYQAEQFNYDHVPYRHKSIERLREGENTYGSPSAVAWRKNDLRFDEKLKWLFDCEFYARMAERYGVPAFVDTPIYIRQWEGMATKTIATGSQRIQDTNYVIEKYR